MTSRGIAFLLAALLLGNGRPTSAEPVPAPAAVRSATIRVAPARPDGQPRDRVALTAMLSITELSADFDPGVDALSVQIGDAFCVAAEPGDGARWKRVRGRPWCWRASVAGSAGCPGKGKFKLDLRTGKLVVNVRRVDAAPATAGGPSRVPLSVVVGQQEFLAVIDFSTYTRKWKHRDPGARPPRDVPDLPGRPDPDDPPSTDGPVGHTELRSGSRYRQDPQPGFRVFVRDESGWLSLWNRDWAPIYGGSPPWVDFSSRMVVTFTGAAGTGFESVSFERKGDDLIGHVVVSPLEVNGGYVPSFRVYGAFAVPKVLGTVTFQVRMSGQTTVSTLDCPRWNPAW